MKKWLVSFVLCFVLLFGTACHRKTVVTNLPTGATSSEVMNWYTAVGVTDQVATTTNDLTNAFIKLNQAGIFPDGPEYAGAMTSLGKIARAGQKASSQLRQVPSHFGESQKALVYDLGSSMLTEFSNVDTLALAGIKNKESQTAVKLLLTSLNAALTIAKDLGSK